MEECKNFVSSDGWLFATLKCLGKEPLNLMHIVAIGDTLNHAIFTLEEIHDGLSRVESEGFIQIYNGRMSFTDKAKLFIKNNHIRFQGCIDEQVMYSNIFKCMSLKNETFYKQYFTCSEYRSVLERYLK